MYSGALTHVNAHACRWDSRLPTAPLCATHYADLVALLGDAKGKKHVHLPTQREVLVRPTVAPVVGPRTRTWMGASIYVRLQCACAFYAE